MNDEYDEILLEFLDDFGEIALKILQSRDLGVILLMCDKLELWLMAFYMEFAHLKEGD